MEKANNHTGAIRNCAFSALGHPGRSKTMMVCQKKLLKSASSDVNGTGAFGWPSAIIKGGAFNKKNRVYS